ncbi:WD40/YVTN/BNR-like repeat-containing protein [Pseudomonas aeruginosa]|uniref:WD40/YVTN/BNR-like repeat-containing protein n=1 Tax=Pseudomonas aeruginosa TaxID=287 RepID=UPI003FA7628B
MRRLDLQWLLVGAVIMGVASAPLSVTADTSKTDDAISFAPPLERPAPLAAQPQHAMLFAVGRAGARLVAVGEHGVIALSDDDGQQWRSAKSVPVDVNLTGVAFADEQNGWAIGHMGVVLHTADGGDSWQKQLDGTQAAAIMLDDARHQARGLDEVAAEDLVYQAEGLVADGPDKPFLDLLVEDRQTLTVVGAFNLALRSTDGGVTWKPFSRLENPSGMHVYALEKLTDGLLAVGEQGLMLKSSDPDTRLVARPSPYDGSYFGLLPLGGRQVLAYGLRGNAYVSDDGGDNWIKARIPGSNSATFNAALRRSNGDVLLLDQSGRVHVSRDQGRDFRTLAFEWGAPLTGAVETASGGVLLSSLAGIVQLPPAALADSASEE